MDKKNFSVLIVNETGTPLDLLIYSRLDRLCWLPVVWEKIIPPGKEYLYCARNPFQFQLREKKKKAENKKPEKKNGTEKKQETNVPVMMCEKDMLLRVTGSAHEIAHEDLTEYPGDKLQILLRRLNMEKECSANSRRNLYEILKIDIEELRRKHTEVQNEMINHAFWREMRRWHPKQNPRTGDLFMCREVIVAYETLLDPESRARYNNAVDYDSGWLSASRWKAIFWSECVTNEQKREYRWRMFLSLSSAVLGAVGLALMCNPKYSNIGQTIFAKARHVGWLAFSRNAVFNGCDLQKYKEILIETVKAVAETPEEGPAVTPQDMASQIADLIFTIFGIVSPPIKSLVETLVQQLLPTTLLRVGIVELLKIIRQMLASDDDDDDGSSRIPEKDLTWKSLHNKYGLDEAEASESSQAPDGGHGAMHTGQSRIGRVCYTTNGAWMSRMIVRYNIGSDERKEEIVEGSGKLIVLPETAKNVEIMFQVLRFIGTWCDVKKYDRLETRWCEPAEAEVFKYDAPPSCSFTLAGPLYYEAVMDVANRPYHELDEIWESGDGRIRYICKGLFGSRMIVEYTNEKNERKKEVVEGSGRSVILPRRARNIDVKFHVLRFIATWCPVKKYDRFKKCWVNTTEQHIFNYDVPPIRTFTIDGWLYYECVSRVTDGTFQEVDDL